MRLFVLNLSLSRHGGGIFTVIKELYQSKIIRKSIYSDINFSGYLDKYSSEDSKLFFGVVNNFKVPIKGLNKILYSLELKKFLFREVSENDIIHLHSLWIYLSILSSNLQKMKNVRKVISTHGMLDEWALKNAGFKKQIALRLFEKKNLNTADCIHALCEQEYKDIRKIAPKTPVALIPNGIYLPLNEDKLSKNKTKTLLFISRIHPKKGLKNLLLAWSHLKPSNWKLVITGPDENNHLEELLNLSSELGINDIVEFTGPKFGEEKEFLLKTSHAFILPSFSEGLPMSILEAWSYKLPVIMTPYCNLPDGYKYNAAIKIEPNKDSIVQGLERLLSMSESEMSKVGNNGYELVKEKYTWDSVAEQMIQLYDWVAGKIKKPKFVRLD